MSSTRHIGKNTTVNHTHSAVESDISTQSCSRSSTAFLSQDISRRKQHTKRMLTSVKYSFSASDLSTPLLQMSCKDSINWCQTLSYTRHWQIFETRPWNCDCMHDNELYAISSGVARGRRTEPWLQTQTKWNFFVCNCHKNYKKY